MARLYLVRHGEAAAAWGAHDPDPGLSALGAEQAAAAAAALADHRVEFALCSPLRRCRETAAPWSAASGINPRIDPFVGEIETPADIPDRRAWLQSLMAGAWSDAPALQPWRRRVLWTLAAQQRDMVVFSHFVAINVVVGAALGRDACVVFHPANASITVVESQSGRFRLIEAGAEAQSRVL